MVREVDLVSYLPPFLADFKEIRLTLEAENPEFVLLWKASDQVLQNEFIATADEFGISRFEKLLGIFPETGDSLEVRRTRVQNRWFTALPFTLKTFLKKAAEILGGEHNFSIQADFKNSYEMVLVVYSIDDSRVEELKYLISSMVPVNIGAELIYESGHRGFVYFGGLVNEADLLEIRQLFKTVYLK